MVTRSTGLGRRRRRNARGISRLAAPRGLAIALLLLALGAPAHDSLYNYVEVRLSSAEGAALEFTVHGPALAARFGVDPTAGGDAWLEELTDAQEAQLLRDAERFVRETYRIRIDGADPLAGRAIHFDPPSAGGERDDPATAPRPGCYVGAVRLAEHPGVLELAYQNTEKRLMLVVTRRGAFPEIHDLAPGGSTRLSLAASSPDKSP